MRLGVAGRMRCLLTVERGRSRRQVGVPRGFEPLQFGALTSVGLGVLPWLCHSRGATPGRNAEFATIVAKYSPRVKLTAEPNGEAPKDRRSVPMENLARS